MAASLGENAVLGEDGGTAYNLEDRGNDSFSLFSFSDMASFLRRSFFGLAAGFCFAGLFACNPSPSSRPATAMVEGPVLLVVIRC